MEEQVYNYLISNHIGKENLIKNKELRKKFNINSDKSLRKVIQNIREVNKLENVGQMVDLIVSKL